MSYALYAQQGFKRDEQAELYDHLAEITPSLDKALEYKNTAENIRLNVELAKTMGWYR